MIIGLFMASVNLSEWYRVGILKATSGYPFGGEGPVPYYYKTAGLYSLVNGIFGTVFLFLTLLAAWSFFRYQRRTGVIAFALTMVTLVIAYLNGRIEP